PSPRRRAGTRRWLLRSDARTLRSVRSHPVPRPQPPRRGRDPCRRATPRPRGRSARYRRRRREPSRFFAARIRVRTTASGATLANESCRGWSVADRAIQDSVAEDLPDEETIPRTRRDTGAGDLLAAIDVDLFDL